MLKFLIEIQNFREKKITKLFCYYNTSFEKYICLILTQINYKNVQKENYKLHNKSSSSNIFL